MEKLLTDLSNKVTGNKENLIAIALENAIENNVHPSLIFSNIRDMAKDNYVAMRDLLGKNLLTDIINFKNK